MSASLVSVIIPVHNGEAYLAEAVQSVLDQSYQPIEIIVVDDGSTDGTATVARSLGEKVTFVAQPQGGVAAARNRGVQEARGERIAFLDADDVWMPEKTAHQAAYLDAHPGVGMVFGLADQFHSPELSEEQREGLDGHGEVLKGYYASGMLVNREAWEQAGPFSTDAKVVEFIEWYARAKERGLRDAMLDEVVVRRRLHGQNWSLRGSAHRREEFLSVAKALIDRRRAAGGEAPPS